MNHAWRACGRPSAGRRVVTRAAAGFVFAEALYGPGAEAPWHDHELMGLAVVCDGRYLKKTDRREHECRPGTLTVEPPGVGHMERYGPVPVRTLLVEVLPWRAATLAEQGLTFAGPVCGEDDAAILLGRRLSVELRELDGASELALEGLGLELFAIAHRLPARTLSRMTASARWLAVVKERLRADFRSDITLGDLAAGAGVHPAHLSRAFRAREGCSVGEFVRRRRIAWTAERLTTTNNAIASIASCVGFYDQSHFTRAFTRDGSEPRSLPRTDTARHALTENGTAPLRARMQVAVTAPG